ncbi:hypothetical protein KC327_g18555 [Hortaea werneckii]|uniref:4a-hydroxytetrahydrobiopterin dehydratase n=1 Tax=Hortaea werneckii TaxID=91943 RepID=A0A3M7H6R4_HORWE|nr:hypothetical protein KC350_g18680 [Hortaea werneckii]KAI6807657.1 hypothetical protein KC358_g13286 [Hortaea werneckii]KAI6894108.1 hypothetical protein KC348_g18549 [Hortaea werneckii]KAI6921322.1 hypothetical protein KC341_g15998 [Hortaea werneckii]KAI6958103.1 hypothetical protein KC329_g17782 [Hortaea werneckii]
MLTRADLSIADSTPDQEALVQETSQLVENGGRWRLCREGRGVERGFKFKTFKVTWDFMTAIATECKRTRHHPEWSNVYNRTQILWTTHSPSGISGRDTQMARFCDAVAREMGEVVEEEGEGGKGDGECCGGGKGEGKKEG